MINTNEIQLNTKLGNGKLSAGEVDEIKKLGILDDNQQEKQFVFPDFYREGKKVEKRAVHAVRAILNEAYDYVKPSSFSRALCLELGEYKVLLISGRLA